MALNLSTLTSPATSGDVLAEALTTADFLEGVPVLRNLARGSQKGGDAKQDVALNQPKALPLDANGKGYLYLSGVSGNYASVPNAANLNGITDFVMEVKDVYMADWAASGLETFFAKYNTGQTAFVFARLDQTVHFYAEYNGVGNGPTFAHGLTGAKTANVKVIRSGTSLSAQIDTGSGYVTIGSTATVPSGAIDTTTTPIEIGSYNGGGTSRLTGKIGQARIWNNATASGTPVLDVDFTATNVRHGDTKFKCATGQVVTVNQSGNDPATIIKKPVLRFDGTNDFLNGVFGQTITEGYMFAAFSVLGDGGEAFSRIFSVNSTGVDDNQLSGCIFSIRNAASSTLDSFYAGNYRLPHVGMFDDANGDILHEVKITNGNQSSLVNNSNLQTATSGTAISSEGFNIVASAAPSNGNNNSAIDLEYLALFPATITDAQADSVRNYINNRNNVFDLKDGFGYYFFDAQKAPAVPITSGSSSWNGRIVGSDNGDTNKYATQSTSNDAPVGDGFKVTFADNSDHLDIPSISQSGWQICGTSLGTFVYRVDSDAVTELNLLGNAGTVRSIGDLYGIILLPESATSADIESARRLLIDRGASDGVSGNTVQQFWQSRNDIVEFKQVDTSSVSSFREGWRFCASLEIFPPLQAPNCTNFLNAWEGNSSLNSFGAIDASGGTTFTAAWKSCSALTSFPAGAKLGTEASSVNFSDAWRASGLTSFPSDIDLSKGTVFSGTWRSTNLNSFSTPVPNGTAFYAAWRDTGLTDFSADVFRNWNPSGILSSVFDLTWDGCALSAQSVENILTSIDASGKYATSTGASGGSALADAGIDIDYNVATGTPAYSTLASLKAKGWSIIVNNVTL